MTIAQRGAKWQARVKEPNGGKYHRVTFDTKEQAEFWEEKAKEAIRQGLSVPESHLSGGVSIRSLADRYSAYLWPNQQRKHIETDIKIAERLLPPDPTRLTTKDLVKFVEKRRMEGASGTTIRHNLSRVRKLLNHADTMGDILLPTVIKWPSVNSSNPRMRYLTVEEEQKLLDAIEIEDYRYLVEFMIDTGCRPSEVMTTTAVVAKPFEWGDVSTSKDGRTLVTFWKTKTNTPRTVPLTQRAYEALDWSREEGHDRPFGDIHHIKFKNYVTETAAKVGLSDIVVYTFRHTCASRLVQRGADIMRVKQWMGHSNIETTLGYAKLAPEDIYTLSDLL
ncbi:integrase [Roseobacter phage CRP-804]|uniref:Integrase n=1 Tax=Roseobacter phage CRP-804 TaxID=3072850 RepID=A0AAX3ZUX4_9CAUD|nr:integrase [Roseobacter phage CRP-804]